VGALLGAPVSLVPALPKAPVTFPNRVLSGGVVAVGSATSGGASSANAAGARVKADARAAAAATPAWVMARRDGVRVRMSDIGSPDRGHAKNGRTDHGVEWWIRASKAQNWRRPSLAPMRR